MCAHRPIPDISLLPAHLAQRTCDIGLKSSLLRMFMRRPPPVSAPCARLRGRKVALSASGEEVPYPLHQRELAL